jgi:hypothetical protein
MLWLPAPGARAVNAVAPYFSPATVTGDLVDLLEVTFDPPEVDVWPKSQMVTAADLHPWPHRCRTCRPTLVPLDPVTEAAELRQRCAALEAERDELRAELFAVRANAPLAA